MILRRAKSRSPARAALAAAIERRDRALAAVEGNRSAHAQVSEASWAARRALDAASEAVETAKAATAVYLTAQALGQAREAPQTITEARSAQQAAHDELDAALAARAALEAARPGAEAEVGYASMAVERAIRQVVIDETDAQRLMAEYLALHRELVSRRRAMLWLEFMGAIPEPGWRCELDWLDLTGDSLLRAWAAALSTDPDAEGPRL